MARKPLPYPTVVFRWDQVIFNQIVTKLSPDATYCQIYIHPVLPIVQFKFGEYAPGALKVTVCNINYMCSGRQVFHLLRERDPRMEVNTFCKLEYDPVHRVYTACPMGHAVPPMGECILHHMVQKEPLYGVTFEQRKPNQFNLRFNTKMCQVLDDDKYTTCELCKENGQYVLKFDTEDGMNIRRAGWYKSYRVSCTRMMDSDLKHTILEVNTKYVLMEHPEILDAYILTNTHCN